VQKLNYLNYYALVEERPDDPAPLLEYSRVIECDEGRQSVRVCDGPIPTIVLRAHELDPTVDTLADSLRPRPIPLGNATVNTFMFALNFDLCDVNFHFVLCLLIFMFNFNVDEVIILLVCAPRSAFETLQV
jgi:hypothetical protein